ncbi:unnamed protein product [Prunus armeniaca]|uniref:Uncharacterized protein n=1 Tax=Prunus armeniaca TaxID=36596 RepID=A0A6J5W445_PRUAR|nr:unnamed protein product [Prunus armeniaca]CAB4295051.1 unnamed protein product [Prunus armeniaca]
MPHFHYNAHSPLTLSFSLSKLFETRLREFSHCKSLPSEVATLASSKSKVIYLSGTRIKAGRLGVCLGWWQSCLLRIGTSWKFGYYAE